MEEGKKIKLHVEGHNLIFEQGTSTVSLSIPSDLKDLYYGVYLYE